MMRLLKIPGDHASFALLNPAGVAVLSMQGGLRAARLGLPDYLSGQHSRDTNKVLHLAIA
jgi:hypothetical protein